MFVVLEWKGWLHHLNWNCPFWAVTILIKHFMVLRSGICKYVCVSMELYKHVKGIHSNIFYVYVLNLKEYMSQEERKMKRKIGGKCIFKSFYLSDKLIWFSLVVIWFIECIKLLTVHYCTVCISSPVMEGSTLLVITGGSLYVNSHLKVVNK